MAASLSPDRRKRRPVLCDVKLTPRRFGAPPQFASKIRRGLQNLQTDVHSPSEFRAATVRNFDPWYAAFGVQESDRMYLPPEKRVSIW
jgi:hypothetical protein